MRSKINGRICWGTGASHRIRLQVWRASSGHGRHQASVGGADRRCGPRPVQSGGARWHRSYGRLHGGPGERVQRGRDQHRYRGTHRPAGTREATASRGRPRCDRARSRPRPRRYAALGQRTDK